MTESFSERLKNLRLEKNLTQYDLAKAVGVNKQTISQYERGVRQPNFQKLEALCDFFEVSADYILGRSE